MATWRRLLPGIVRQAWRYKLRSSLVILCAALGVSVIGNIVLLAMKGEVPEVEPTDAKAA